MLGSARRRSDARARRASGGVEVYSSTGTYIGTVATGESSNCTFGGADRKTLYVTSRAVLKYVTLNVPGLPD